VKQVAKQNGRRQTVSWSLKLRESLTESQLAMVIFDYCWPTVAEITDLRRRLRPGTVSRQKLRTRELPLTVVMLTGSQ